MREIFVTDLVRDILGPRNGPFERMKESPLSEYITGVLAPLCIPENLSYEELETGDIPDTGETGEDDETTDTDIQPPPLLQPALNPQNLPSSFGISFMITAINKTEPTLEVCLTWARYVKQNQENSWYWERSPRCAILQIKRVGNQVFWFDSSGKQTSQQNAEISFHVLFTRKNNGLLVNMYMVNRIQIMTVTEDQNFVECCIFQPQIRVVCGDGTEIIACEDINQQISAEEREMAFLYRHRPLMARGFLCSAIWKDIDPANPWNGKLYFETCINDPPFGWPDGQIIPQQEREKFLVPHVRSEFVPIYSIPFPDMDWPFRYGRPPECRATVLASKFNADFLRSWLAPLVEGYREWIENLRNQADQFHTTQREITDRLISRCNDVLRRMNTGLDLILTDDDVRLCFCFANMAMDLQSQWVRKQPLIWRPFQLGYILTVLESLANPDSPDRDICDLLWVPTGAGKTEAYLFLIIFNLALRRRKALRNRHPEAGVSVITRYTLRLLTIQQFRRLLTAITACEYLRVDGLGERLNVGWAPADYGNWNGYLWGTVPFSAGLWVGGGVTPNRMGDTWSGEHKISGAISILKGHRGEGEPAQVINCPACGTILSVPETGINGNKTLHLVIKSSASSHQIWNTCQQFANQVFKNITIKSIRVTSHTTKNFFTLSLELLINGRAGAREIDNLWNDLLRNKIPGDPILLSARASRPGYFIRRFQTGRGQQQEEEYDFEIFCTNPECSLHRPWCAGAPAGLIHDGQAAVTAPSGGIQNIPDMTGQNRFIHIQNHFRLSGNPFISDRIPIPAYTVDEQVYHRLPSVVVSTVDKFARPAFEPRASALFGNVDHYHCIWGYYRQGTPPLSAQNINGHPSPAGRSKNPNYVQTGPVRPPDLIIQDELHLIEGPLGSLMGFYETAVDFLCKEGGNIVKYIASTATIRNAEDQIQAVFARRLAIFPPPGLDISDRFFIREREIHPLDDQIPGRLYVGICAPRRGPHTPIYKIYARLLQTAENNKNSQGIDPFWTLTGYFNAIRELAGTRALYRQDIPARLRLIGGNSSRTLTDDRVIELSSRIDSTELPALLEILTSSYPDAPDALFTTSMFGTGVDIPRLALMVVNGQPKTTSSYIQATGRVGRTRGALVVTFLRASRPRDLSHYEFFCGYHRQLQRFVEPVTVYPFAPGVLDLAAGPLIVFILRNMRNTTIRWHEELSASQMGKNRNVPEVQNLPYILELRVNSQPATIRPDTNQVKSVILSKLDRWQNIAKLADSLRYVEYAINVPPRYDVVLGDSWHQHERRTVVYENAPQSLREIEETCGFET